MPEGQPLVRLADAISDLRAELITAMKQAEGQELQFRLKPVELEFQVAVTKSAEANASVRFWILTVAAEAGAKGSYENAVTHTVKLTLEPIGDIRVSETGVKRPD